MTQKKEYSKINKRRAREKKRNKRPSREDGEDKLCHLHMVEFDETTKRIKYSYVSRSRNLSIISHNSAVCKNTYKYNPIL